MSEPYFLKLTLMNGKPILINVAQVVGIRANDSEEPQTVIFSTDGERPFTVEETMEDILDILPRAWVSR